MATQLKSAFNVISESSNEKTQNSVIKKAKLELLETLDVDNKMINRNELAYGLSQNRYNNGKIGNNIGLPGGQINFKGKIISINQTQYPKIIKIYEDLITKKPDGYEKILEKLDTQFAEMLILDSGNMIEFKSTDKFADNKTAEEVSKLCYNTLNEIAERYKNKIDLVSKKNGNETYFVIKRTEKQLEKIKKIIEDEKSDENKDETKVKKLKFDENNGLVIDDGKENKSEKNQKISEIIESVKNRKEKQEEQIKEKDEKIKKLKLQLNENKNIKKENEIIYDMDSKNINDKKLLKDKIDQMRIGATLIIKKGSTQVARLHKHDENGFICEITTDDELEKFIDIDYYIIEDGKKSYVSYISKKNLWKFLRIKTPAPAPAPTPNHQKEITATISNTTEVNRAIAEREAGEKLRERYRNTSRYKPRSRPDKLNLFLRRQFIKDRLTRKLMKGAQGLNRDDASISAADRHEIEQANNLNDRIQVLLTDIDVDNYPNTRHAIDALVDQLVGNPNTMPPWRATINDAQFRTQFNSILTRRPPLDNARPVSATQPNRRPIAELLRHNDMDQISTNILEKLNSFRDHQSLVYKISDHIRRNPLETSNIFSAYCRPEIANYISRYKSNPDFLKQLNVKLDDPNAMQEIRRLQSHNGALQMISAQTMRLKLQLLNKGDEAYNVKQEGGKFTKIGNRLDNPLSEKRRKKHPGLSEAFGRLWGATKVAAVVTPGMLLGFGPLAMASYVGGTAALKTFFAKFAHYNKEHKGYQRNQAVNLSENRQERERLMKIVEPMSGLRKNFLYFLGLGKKAREVRQYVGYVKTTQDQLSITPQLNTNIENLLNSNQQLTPIEQSTLEQYISDGLARLDFHSETSRNNKGQNFLGSEKFDVAETDYRKLHRLVLASADRLGIDLATIRGNNYYADTRDIIEYGTGDEIDQIGYNQARKRFSSRQREKAIRGALRSGGIAFGLSYLASNLFSSKGHEVKTHLKDAQDNFGLGGHQAPGSNNIYNMSKDVFNDPNSANQTIQFSYGANTDATHLIKGAGDINGSLGSEAYTNKLNEVITNINNMTNLSATTKQNLIDQLQNKPRESSWTQGYTNDYLQGMRCSEGLEQLARSLNDSTNAGNIIIKPDYFTINAGDQVNDVTQRIVEGSLDKIGHTGVNNVSMPGYAFMNTFKSPDNDPDRGNDTPNNQQNNFNNPRRNRSATRNTN